MRIVQNTEQPLTADGATCLIMISTLVGGFVILWYYITEMGTSDYEYSMFVACELFIWVLSFLLIKRIQYKKERPIDGEYIDEVR